MQSNKILNSLFSHIAVLDSDGIIQFVNKSWLEFASLNGGNVDKTGKGANYFEVCEQASKTDYSGEAILALKGITKVISGEQSKFEMEYPCHSPEERRWFLMRCSRMEFDDTLIVVSHIDITKQKEFEKSLHDEQKNNQLIVDSLMVGIAVANFQGVILFVNSAFSKLYQFSSEELIGRHASEIIHPEYKQEFNRFIDELSSTGQFSGNTIDVRKDGSTFYTEIKGTTVKYKGETCVLAVVNDISDKIKAEEARKQSQEIYSAFFENNQNMIIIIDPLDGAIVDANPSACNYYGYPKIVMQNMFIGDITALSETDINAEMQKAISEDRNYFNFKHRLADDTLREVEVFSGPIQVCGKTLLCSIIHDITERLAFEKERDELIIKLQNASDEIKKLKGVLPICAHCKNIRDDKGYWKKIEEYVTEHSEAQFSHGICPDCLEKYFPGFSSSKE